MTKPANKTLVSWSSGKDSAWMLHVLRQDPDTEVAGLLTTIEQDSGMVPMQGVGRELVAAQARAAGLPVRFVELPRQCSNAEYERRMAAAFESAREAGFTRLAFGDLYLHDIRAYRERQMAGTGLEPCFPLWGRDTAELARNMVDGGLRAVVTCIDPDRLGSQFLGRVYDLSFIAELPEGIDPCGENGEFHTFCVDGPMFAQPIAMTRAERCSEQGFELLRLQPGR